MTATMKMTYQNLNQIGAVAGHRRPLTAIVAGIPRRLLDTLLLWQERESQRRQLMQMDARLLKDIGVSRAQARAEFDKPFWRG